jgi:hypothetical protein
MLASALLPAAAEAADFSQPGTSPEAAGTGPASLAVGDFNNDGRRDQAVANAGSNDVTILLGDGTGDFTAAGTSPEAAGTNPRAVVVGDFNGDGKQDLAVPNAVSDTVTILLGDGTGNFTAPGTSPETVGDSPFDVAVGDFDGDGKQDLAVPNSASDNLTILLGDGTGDFTAAGTSPEPVGDAPVYVAVGDFDSDGKQDLATANNVSSDVTILLGDGTGDFTAAGTETIGVGPTDVAVGDFDRNGMQDLAVTRFSGIGTSGVTILLGDGTGNFNSAGTEGTGTNPREVTVADFNGDGRQDLATANFGSTNVTILLGDGTGNFTSAATSPEAAGSQPFGVAAGDFDGNSKPDLTVANNGSNNVTILLNQAPSMATGDFLAAGTSPEAAGSGPISLAVGDFNNDGKPDQAVANINSDDVTILLGDGTGNFTAAGAAEPAGNGPISITMGDFNGNRKQDLAVANQASNDVTILLGDGTGDFTAAGTESVGAGPASVAVGDFNGNGKQDLAVANFTTVNILLGDGAGDFTAVGPETAGTAPTSVAVGDFNGNGKQDLAVANYGSTDVTILLGDGTGDFTVAGTEAAGTNPISVAVGDFNGNGRQDLAVANRSSNNVTILLGDGSGDFTAAGGPEAAGTGPTSVAAGDFNGNGHQDLAISNQVSNDVTILLGDGTGDFTAAGTSPEAAGSAPVSVAVGDFDRNGGPDLAIANSGSNNVTVLLDEADSDLDGINDSTDVCPNGAAMGTDTDGDGCKDAAEDSDDDNDGVADGSDSCPIGATAGTDTDGDGCKDAVEDSDDDNDTVPDTTETGCATTSGPGISTDTDSDDDAVLDGPDVFPCDPAETADADGDAIGDNADPDDDNDTVPDTTETGCPGGGIPTDTDSDDDTVLDGPDVFPCDPAESADTDGDTLGDNADNCPTTAGPASNGGCPVAVPVPPVATPPLTATPAPKKKCKKGQKLKRGKCVKVKRKKK